MYTRCLICRTPFDENGELEHLPLGRRVAFDPRKGRLWVVCLRCKRWSLVPLEARWEALEELERVVKDRGRRLGGTDHISLLEAGPLELVRVGREAGLPEEAWWRFGRELITRRDRYRKLSAAGAVGLGAVAVGGWATGGLGFLGAWFLWTNQEWASKRVTEGARWLRFGSAAWRGREDCTSCGFPIRALRFRDRSQLQFRFGREQEEEVVSVRLPCPRCGREGPAGLHLRGREGERALVRILAYTNHAGARRSQVLSATRLLQEAGSPSHLRWQVAGEGNRLGSLPRVQVMALEIASAEGEERRLLELEAAELEAHWREEEELAAIVDGELTPVPLLEGLRRRVLGLGAGGESTGPGGVAPGGSSS